MPIDASHALARMLWVSRHQPEIWERTRWVVLPKDYCLHHLTGTMATDPQSNVGLTNRAGYIAEVLALVSGAAERMAPLAAPQAVMGQGRTGGPLAGLPVVTGTMDGWCALYGAGGSAEGAGVHLRGQTAGVDGGDEAWEAGFPCGEGGVDGGAGAGVDAGGTVVDAVEEDLVRAEGAVEFSEG
jgi:xylulokinase